jgi:hypothetical protein
MILELTNLKFNKKVIKFREKSKKYTLMIFPINNFRKYAIVSSPLHTLHPPIDYQEEEKSISRQKQYVKLAIIKSF